MKGCLSTMFRFCLSPLTTVEASLMLVGCTLTYYQSSGQALQKTAKVLAVWFQSRKCVHREPCGLPVQLPLFQKHIEINRFLCCYSSTYVTFRWKILCHVDQEQLCWYQSLCFLFPQMAQILVKIASRPKWNTLSECNYAIPSHFLEEYSSSAPDVLASWCLPSKWRPQFYLDTFRSAN